MERSLEPSSVPPKLTFYRGGLNVGVFQPGPPVYPIGSELFGNPDKGNPKIYRTTSVDPGEKSQGWMLIVSGRDSKIAMKNYGERRSVGIFSDYDGLYNKSKLTTGGKSKISNFNKGNYTDWYIPSRDELAFICKNLPENFYFDARFDPMTQRYISSTYVKNSTRKQNFLYIQSFYPNTYNVVTPFQNPPEFLTTYGVTSIVEDVVEMYVRYVRRVPVKLI